MSSTEDNVPAQVVISNFLATHGLPYEFRYALEDLIRLVARAPDATSLLGATTSEPTLVFDEPTGEVSEWEGMGFDTLDLPDDGADGSWVGGAVGLTAYGELGWIDHGGMGEILRVSDQALGRTLVMKVVRAQFADSAAVLDHFVDEARITAQLTHPGIVPVHELGRLADGRPYFTMKEVIGSTLTTVLTEREQGGHDAASLPRLLDIFRRVCQAMAYAHARGVVHADLKPENIMVGGYGEVLVMDWGLARVVERPDGSSEPPIQTDSARGLRRHLDAGTPAYMSPEQLAVAGTDQPVSLTPASDVFALGVMLFRMLAGDLPARGGTAAILAAWRGGTTAALPHDTDESLAEICHRALAFEPGDRYGDAGELAADVVSWLEGSRRRERARAILSEAKALAPRVGPLVEEATALREQVRARRGAVGQGRGVDDVLEEWKGEDEADRLDQEVGARLAELTQRLHGALVYDSEAHEAHEILARLHYDRHLRADAARDRLGAARHLIALRTHDRGHHQAYLSGTNTVTVVTDRPARARLFRIDEDRRLLQATYDRDLGHTPLVEVPLPIGSYLVELTPSDGPTVTYPVRVGRLAPWSGVRPGAREPHVLRLPRHGQLGTDEVLVLGGPMIAGGDPAAAHAPDRREVWVDDFVISRDPVDARAFFAFLASPTAPDEALASLGHHAQVWRSDWPAVGMSFTAASTCAAWWSAQTGLDWRLPAELEWEKAARGVDGRHFPWGDHIDDALCHHRGATDDGPPLPWPVSRYALDESPYGVRGMAGNSRDWCLDAWRSVGPHVTDDGIARIDVDEGFVPELRAVRGGSWRQPANSCRCASRVPARANMGHEDVGLRLVRPWVEAGAGQG